MRLRDHSLLLALNVVAIVALLYLAREAYHLWVEDDGPIWVNTQEPAIKTPSVPEGQGWIVIDWTGFYRRHCEVVHWSRTGVRLNENGEVARVDWKLENAPGPREKSDVQVLPWRSPIPDDLTPGRYRVCFTEVAECNGVRSWINEQGCVEFDVTATG